ncbi:hypothetical protein AABC73_20475 [Pseudomonas sp. G.S.17]|uniref:WD40/YVTN/BNR-like repeat-containing protein n=1 Tax=Pseudomonas sp. G.S.17 TaxID=3137451 RepID=UPI00311CC00E
MILGNPVGNIMGNPFNLAPTAGDIVGGIGDIVPRATSPGGSFLKLNGAILAKTDYPKLFDVLGQQGKLNSNLPTVNTTTFPPVAVAGVVFGGDGYYAVANGNLSIYKSTDGSSWSVVAAGVFTVGGGWISYANGALFAGEQNDRNTIKRSVDGGVSWTTITVSLTTTYMSVVYAKGAYVLLTATSSGALRSTDLITWVGAGSISGSFRSAAVGKGTIVVPGGSNNQVYTSIDGGASWVTSVLGAGNWSGSAFGNDIFMVTNRTNNTLYTSADGLAWVAGTQPGSSVAGTLSFGDGLFYGMGGTGAVYTTLDGADWTLTNISGGGSYAWGQTTYGNYKFVAVTSSIFVGLAWDRFAYDPILNFQIPTVLLQNGLSAYVKAK